MAKGIWRFACAGALLLVFHALPLQAQSQETKSSGGTITGCLQKGEEAGGYTLKADDGTTYELMGDTIDLAPHVGHKVSLTGRHVMEHKSSAPEKEAMERREAGGGKSSDFKVAGLKMVSSSCQ